MIQPQSRSPPDALMVPAPRRCPGAWNEATELSSKPIATVFDLVGDHATDVAVACRLIGEAVVRKFGFLEENNNFPFRNAEISATHLGV